MLEVQRKMETGRHAAAAGLRKQGAWLNFGWSDKPEARCGGVVQHNKAGGHGRTNCPMGGVSGGGQPPEDGHL